MSASQTIFSAPELIQSSSRRSRSRAALGSSVFSSVAGEGSSSLAPLCHSLSEEPVTRLSRSDMMRSDGSFLQNSSLPLIHPYQRVNPSSYSVPLKPLRILELTSRANRAVLIKDHLALVQISLIECQSGMFAWQRGGKWAIV